MIEGLLSAFFGIAGRDRLDAIVFCFFWITSREVLGSTVE